MARVADAVHRSGRESVLVADFADFLCGNGVSVFLEHPSGCGACRGGPETPLLSSDSPCVADAVLLDPDFLRSMERIPANFYETVLLGKNRARTRFRMR